MFLGIDFQVEELKEEGFGPLFRTDNYVWANINIHEKGIENRMLDTIEEIECMYEIYCENLFMFEYKSKYFRFLEK